MMINITLELPRLHRKQKEVKAQQSRFNVLCCGRRFGKTTLGEDILTNDAIKGGRAAWYSPTYKDMLEVWRDVIILLSDLISKKNASEKRIELITGGIIDFWTCENKDAGRGRKYNVVIVDEAAKVPHLLDMWQQTIRPTLADFKGSAWFLSTPRGYNDFWKLYRLGQDETMKAWSSWQYSTFDNPYMDTAEINVMKSELPEMVFSQEILASFVDVGGGVFRGIDKVTADYWQEKPLVGHNYVFGVDWAKSKDYTVITVIDCDTKEVCHIDRFNKISYTFQAERVKALYEKFRPTSIIAEANAMGEALIDYLVSLDVRRIQRVNMSQSKKKEIIESLSLAIEKQDIRLHKHDILISELQAYEATIGRSGLVKYSAPAGMHDDCVMSLALAWSGAKDSGSYLLW